MFVGNAQNKPKKQFKKTIYKQRNTLKLEMNGTWKKQNLLNNWNCNLKKFPNFPTFTQNKRKGVVPIWRARKNQVKAKDQQRNTLKGVE
jgi:hypothetical protein